MDMLTLKVKDIEQLTSGIKKFVLQAPEAEELPSFSAGSHIDLYLENGLIKSYSLANDPSESNRYVTAILREANGAGGSLYMHLCGSFLENLQNSSSSFLETCISRAKPCAGTVRLRPSVSASQRNVGTPKHSSWDPNRVRAMQLSTPRTIHHSKHGKTGTNCIHILAINV